MRATVEHLVKAVENAGVKLQNRQARFDSQPNSRRTASAMTRKCDEKTERMWREADIACTLACMIRRTAKAMTALTPENFGDYGDILQDLEVCQSQGRGPRYRKLGRRMFYCPSDLQEFAAGQLVETIDSYGR